jgi:hypothetical protein
MNIVTRRELPIRWAAKLILLAFACSWVPVAPRAWTQERKLTEYQVKVAYLYNFAKFTQWPAGTFSDPTAPVIFGILGDDTLGNEIDILTSRTINNRKIQVRRYHSLAEIQKCHVLFISTSEHEHLRKILKSLSHSGMLLVSDMENFARRGGMIGLIVTDKTIGFEVNIEPVARAGITLHSRLLNMAVIVREDPSKEDQ